MSRTTNQGKTLDVALRLMFWVGKSYLDETNVGALLAEALTADVQAVLADETSRVGADAAVSTSLATVQVYKPLYSPAPTACRAAALAVRLLCRLRLGKGNNVPLAGALAVGPRTRIPDRLVRHVGWMCVGLRGRCCNKDQYTIPMDSPPKGILTVLAAGRRGCRSFRRRCRSRCRSLRFETILPGRAAGARLSEWSVRVPSPLREQNGHNCVAQLTAISICLCSLFLHAASIHCEYHRD
jgi:hypothetical protein